MNLQPLLLDKIILVTRPANQADDLVGIIERYGGTAIRFPTIEIIPPDSWDDCDRAIDGLYMYDGIIFTSANGVEFFFQRLAERNAAIEEFKSKQVFVVGEKTKQAVERIGLSVTAIPEKFTAFDLTRMLQQQDLHGKTFLFPHGNLGNDNLANNLKLLSAHVDSVIVYQTVQPPLEHIQHLRDLLAKKKIDILTFTSPSAFNNFASHFPKRDVQAFTMHAKIAVIGPSTASAVEDFGIDVDIVPKSSTIEAMVEAIAEFFSAHVHN